ncbi:unnamed protein product, partial [Prorocentrum cordatum]
MTTKEDDGKKEDQGETLLLHLTKEAATATGHLRPGSVQFAGGLRVVVMALDTLAFPEADAETFQHLEKIVFAAPRSRGETHMTFTNRIRSEQKELVRLLPNAPTETAMGFLLLRGAGLAKTMRNQVPIQTGCDYDVNKLVVILKRMTDDNTVTEKTISTRTGSYLAGLKEEEPQNGKEDEDEDNPIYDAMANLRGIDDGNQEPDDKFENGQTLKETEALDCLAALLGPPPKPRMWGGPRTIVADEKTNRGFHNIKDRKRTEENIEDIKKRTKCGICKELGHWHNECSDNPKNENKPTGGFYAVTVLQDDEARSYVATEANMATLLNMVEHIPLAIDIEKSGGPGWGAVGTACGFNMMGLETFDDWIKHYKGAHNITLETVPYHKKCRLGNDQVSTATEGFSDVIFACLVQGAAPLLLSKNFVGERKASLRAFQSELDLPEQRGHYLLQLGSFAQPWEEPASWTLCSREVPMDFGTGSERIHPSTSTHADLERLQEAEGQAETERAEANPVSSKRGPKVKHNSGSKKICKWPWHGIGTQPRPPTWAQICRFLGIPNQGPCPPKSGLKLARDHDPARETACIHEFTNHGGDGRAVWARCCGGNLHLECHPQPARGMPKVINMLNDIKDEGARIKGWRPRATRASNKKGDTATKSPESSEAALTSPRTAARTDPKQQAIPRQQMDELEETEEWEQLDESPRSKALTKLRELIQNENANETTNPLVDNLRDHLGADIGDLQDPLVKKLKRLPYIEGGGALRKGRSYFSILPKEAMKYAKLLSQEVAGALARTVAKPKATQDLGEKNTEDNNNTEIVCTQCCAAPTTIAAVSKGEKSTDTHGKRQVQKIHENMGHCSNEDLVMVRKCGQARHAYIDAAQKLECPSCVANKRTKLAKPSKAPTAYQFNDVIGMGIFFVMGPENTAKVPVTNVVSHGTGHQVVIPLPSRHGLQMRRHYRALWRRVYGVSRMIITDGEKGFFSGEFPEAAAGDGSEIKVASATFYRTRQAFNANNWADFYELVDAVNAATGEGVRSGASRQPPIAETEETADVNPDLIPIGLKYYDHLDDARFTIRQKADNPSSAMPVSERIATSEERIAEDAAAPPHKKVKKAKVPAMKLATPTSTNPRLPKEITEKSLLNTYKHQPYIVAKRREWIMGSRWALADKGGNPDEADASKRQLMLMNGGAWRMAKARWVVQGRVGPDLLGLEKYSPVVGADSVFLLILQILCSNKWTLQRAHIASAFAAGNPLDPSRRSLYVELPRTGAPDVGSGSLVELLMAVYGQGDAPLQWLSAFAKCAKEIGFQRPTFDSCVCYLRGEKGAAWRRGPRRGKLPNLVVDDLLEANRIGRMPKEFSSVVPKINHIPFHDMAAWANARDGASQAGYIAFATQRKIFKGEPAITLAISISEGIAIAEFTRTMLLEIVDNGFDLMRPYMLASMFPFISVTDSKGGRDHVTNPKAGLAEDKRAAIDVAIVRAAMQRPEVHLRWIEGAAQIRAVFLRHDPGRTGRIDRSKVEAVFQKLEATPVGRLFTQHPEALDDFSRSGALEYERFLAWLCDDPGELGGGEQEPEASDGSRPESEASYAFDGCDYDNATYLSPPGTQEAKPNSPPELPDKPADSRSPPSSTAGSAAGDAGGVSGSSVSAGGCAETRLSAFGLLAEAKGGVVAMGGEGFQALYEDGASEGAGAGAGGAPSTVPVGTGSTDGAYTSVVAMDRGATMEEGYPRKSQQQLVERTGSGATRTAPRGKMSPEEHAAQEQRALLSAAFLLLLWAGLVVTLARTARHFEAPACPSSVEGLSVCEPCGEGLNLLPAFGEFEQSWPPALRALLYFLGLMWLFQGVGEVCNAFMAAIEEITSSESVNLVPLEDGGNQTFIELKVKVWNPTVANLTLMALGSSAPEILLSVIEVVFGGFEIGRLGTSTIVGSAAFNLFVISAVCICALDPGQTRMIEQPAVFAVTSVFALFAYFWVLFVLDMWTPQEVTSTEGLLTLMMFPAIVVCAYIADRYADLIFVSLGLSGQDGQQPASKWGGRSLSTVAPEVTKIRSCRSMDLGVCDSLSSDAGIRRALKAEAIERSKTFPLRLDVDLDEPPPMQGTKSEKRKMACGKVNGGWSPTVRAQRSDADPDQELVFSFKCKTVTVDEGAGPAVIAVVASRRPRCEVAVPWETRDGSARSTSTCVDDPRYQDANGELVFGPAAKLEQRIEVQVINDDKWQATEFFEVRLLRPRSEAEVAKLQDGECNASCKVMIHDDDHPGLLCFDWPKVFAKRSQFTLRVSRMHGARGAISCKVRVRAAAKSEWQREQEVKFEDEETSSVVNLVLDGNQGTTFTLELVDASIPECLKLPAEGGE